MEPENGGRVCALAENDLIDALVAGRHTDGTQRTAFDDPFSGAQ
jgi:hypothetical protein